MAACVSAWGAGSRVPEHRSASLTGLTPFWRVVLNAVNTAQKVLHSVDRLQQRRPGLAFPVAVWKKFGDDQAGNLAALIAYYAFASIFPLLLVLVTVLDIVLGHDPTLRQKILGSAFGQFPVIGTQLKTNVHSLHETGLALLIGPAGYVGAIVVSLLLNIGLFWLGFRLATASEVRRNELFLGALLAAIVWQILQLLGSYLVSHDLSKSNSLYGVFGVVLGLMAWLYLQAEFTLYAVEAAVVKSRRLWPRTLVPPPLHDPDRRAYELYAQAQQRFPGEEIDIRIADDPTKQPADQAPARQD